MEQQLIAAHFNERGVLLRGAKWTKTHVTSRSGFAKLNGAISGSLTLSPALPNPWFCISQSGAPSA
jgi:hypothetical protein